MASSRRSLVLIALALVALLSSYLYLLSSSDPETTPPTFDRPSATPLPRPPPSALGHPRRVAIVGSGASGSSAAFFLSRAARATGGEGEVELVVFERDGRVGGRSTTVRPYGPAGPEGEGVEGEDVVELGASIFVDANRNLMRAVDHFNLSLVPFADSSALDRPSAGHDPLGMGLWDGSSFLLTTSTSLGWWDKTKLVLRYGFASPWRTQQAVEALVKRFGQMYDAMWVREYGPWDHVEGLSERLGLGGPEEVSGERWFRDVVKAGERWVGEMVEAVVRVNYAQDVPSAHGLATAVSLATTGASAVRGGNWQIFASFLKASGAEVRLRTEVLSITGYTSPTSGLPQFAVSSRQIDDDNDGRTKPKEELFDAVLFAGPLGQSGVELFGSLAPAAEAIPEQPYVHLHTTLLSTSSPSLSPDYFNLAPDGPSPPSTVLTTGLSARKGLTPDPEFQSITYHGRVDRNSSQDIEEGEEWVVKIFSKERRDGAWLDEVFGEGNVGWVLRKEWRSYPFLPPTTHFPPIIPVPSLPFYYLAALEPWISTMETQTLSARNAVGLLVRDWWGVGMGSCVGKKQGEMEGQGGQLEGGWDWTC